MMKNMFGLDFTVDDTLDQFCDWIYGKLIMLSGKFFNMVSMMGVELFRLDWIKAVPLFFCYFAWALHIVDVIMAMLDAVTGARRGKGGFQDLALNIVRGPFTVSLFTAVPIDLYVSCISLPNELTGAIAGMPDSLRKPNAIAIMVLGNFEAPGTSVVISIMFVILIGYTVIRAFFASPKRGDILLVVVVTDSLYLPSVSRGYSGGFVSWYRQVAALCLTAFLQTIVLIAGLITYDADMLLGIGLILSDTKVPRVAQDSGLDTSMCFNATSTVYSVSSVVSIACNVGGIASR